MEYFIAQLINGLGVGSIYALIALGYSMVYGIVKLINFAHGEIIMVGGYTLFVCLTTIPLSPALRLPIALICTIITCTITGLLVQRVAYRRLLVQKAPRISLLITAIGVSMFLQNLAQLIFHADTKVVPQIFDVSAISFGNITIEFSRILNIVVMILMMIGLTMLVNHSRMGKAMRATSEDAGAAQLMGINSNQVIAFTFAIGSALAGVGAILYTNTYPNTVSPTMGGMLGLKAFVAAVLGGIGNIPGAMIGGLILGLAEGMTVAYGNGSYSDAVVFGLLIVILLFKPTGLLGKNIKEKV